VGETGSRQSTDQQIAIGAVTRDVAVEFGAALNTESAASCDNAGGEM
jgi:hypothetical protein